MEEEVSSPSKHMKGKDQLSKNVFLSCETRPLIFLSSASHSHTPPSTILLFCTCCVTHPPLLSSHIHSLSPPPPHAVQVGVRTCRLPLFWVAAIQFSGCCKPAHLCVPLSQTTTSPFPSPIPGIRLCVNNRKRYHPHRTLLHSSIGTIIPSLQVNT